MLTGQHCLPSSVFNPCFLSEHTSFLLNSFSKVFSVVGSKYIAFSEKKKKKIQVLLHNIYH